MTALPGAAAASWRRRLHGESGSGGGISLLMLFASAALIMIMGLVVDVGAKAEALDRANQLAFEAARAGLQVVNPAADRVDAVAVERAVDDYLQARGVTGSGAIANQRITVTVTLTEPTKMLSAIGIDSMTVTGEGIADLVYEE